MLNSRRKQYYLVIIVASFYNFCYGQGVLSTNLDTIFNLSNREVKEIFESNEKKDTLFLSNDFLILFNEDSQENFLCDSHKGSLFNLGRFSGSCGTPPSDVKLFSINNDGIAILYYSTYCQAGYCQDYYLLYLYYNSENFVIEKCCFADLSIVKIGKEKNNAIYNECKFDVENKKITIYEYLPYKHKNRKYQTNVLECYW